MGSLAQAEFDTLVVPVHCLPGCQDGVLAQLDATCAASRGEYERGVRLGYLRPGIVTASVLPDDRAARVRHVLWLPAQRGTDVYVRDGNLVGHLDHVARLFSRTSGTTIGVPVAGCSCFDPTTWGWFRRFALGLATRMSDHRVVPFVLPSAGGDLNALRAELGLRASDVTQSGSLE